MKNITFSSLKFKQYLQNKKIFYSYFQTPAGKLTVFSTKDGIFNASFENVTKEDYSFCKTINTSTLILVGTQFQISVWQKTLAIKLGQTYTYQSIAQSLARPKAYRAVAQALAHNKIAYFIPCHGLLIKMVNSLAINGELKKSGSFWKVKRQAPNPFQLHSVYLVQPELI